MITNSTVSRYLSPICLATEKPENFFSPDYCPVDRNQQSMGEKSKNVAEIFDKSFKSSVKTVFISEAKRIGFNDEFDRYDIAKLSVGQFVSSALTQKVEEYTENPVYRCMAYAAGKSGRNMLRGSGYIPGAISGAGYCITSEIANTFKKNERSQEVMLAIKIAGAYVTEMVSSIPPCIHKPVTCPVSIAKGAVVASIVSGFHIYDYLTSPEELPT